MSNIPAETSSDHEAVMQSRRRLLRAAAAAAPLIATLPNGAAAATASTAQCIVQGQKASPSNAILPADYPQGDGFVRQNGVRALFKKDATGEEITVYAIAPANTTWYLESGQPFNPSDNGFPSTPQSQEEVQLLRVFKPVSASASQDNPTSLENCGQTPIPPQCIYPVAKRVPGAGSFENTGAFTSCLCSVNPGLLGGACPP